MVTTEEAGAEFTGTDLYDPEVSTPIKQYIENRLTELLNAYQNNTYTPDYRVATEDRLGVVRSGDVVQVNPNTGKMEISKFDEIEGRFNSISTDITNITESLESNNTET